MVPWDFETPESVMINIHMYMYYNIKCIFTYLYVYIVYEIYVVHPNLQAHIKEKTSRSRQTSFCQELVQLVGHNEGAIEVSNRFPVLGIFHRNAAVMQSLAISWHSGLDAEAM